MADDVFQVALVSIIIPSSLITYVNPMIEGETFFFNIKFSISQFHQLCRDSFHLTSVIPFILYISSYYLYLYLFLCSSLSVII